MSGWSWEGVGTLGNCGCRKEAASWRGVSKIQKREQMNPAGQHFLRSLTVSV